MDPKSVHSSIDMPPGVPGVRQDPLNLIFKVWCANIHPKLKELRPKLKKKIIKKPCFITVS